VNDAAAISLVQLTLAVVPAPAVADAGSAPDGAVAPGEDASTSGADAGVAPVEPKGCGCTATGGGPLLAGLLALLGLARRRP
jgi:MYXO-CTERM domain-containing protein